MFLSLLRDAPINIQEIARGIPASSNFQFEVIVYRWEGDARPLPEAARAVLEAFIATPDLHAPLRDRFPIPTGNALRDLAP